MLRRNTTFDCWLIFFYKVYSFSGTHKLKSFWVFAKNFFLILHYGSALLRELEVGDEADQSVRVSGCAASQHPLHVLWVLSGSAVPPNRALFPSGGCHSQVPWTLFSTNILFGVKFPIAIYFYVPFIPLQRIYCLSCCFCPSDVCWLSPCPSHVTLLAVHQQFISLPHKSKAINLILSRAKSEEGLTKTETKVKYRV